MVGPGLRGGPGAALGLCLAAGVFLALASLPGATAAPSGLGRPGPEVRSLAVPVHVVISAGPASGTAPLAVTFRANASGGTGVFVSYRWQFGDGGTASGPSFVYTFLDPGNYTVSLVVTDNATDAGNATITIHVLSPPPPGPSPPTNPLFVPALGLGAAAGALGMYLLDRYRAPRRACEPRDEAPEPPPTPVGPISVEPSPVPVVPPTGASGITTALAPASVSADALRLSQKVVVHLGVYGAPSHRQMARIESTQIGMARLFGVSQSAISNVLQRLADAGVVTSELRHVAGHGRRLRTYALTFRGEQIAKDLEERLRGGRAVPGGSLGEASGAPGAGAPPP